MAELIHFIDDLGRDVFADWVASLKDKRAMARIAVRLTRLECGLFGDCRFLGNGVWELRIDEGPGYRVYYGQFQKFAILLLCGGDKRTQRAISSEPKNIGRSGRSGQDRQRRWIDLVRTRQCKESGSNEQ